MGFPAMRLASHSPWMANARSAAWRFARKPRLNPRSTRCCSMAWLESPRQDGREDLARRLEESDGAQLVEVPGELGCLGDRDDHALLPGVGMSSWRRHSLSSSRNTSCAARGPAWIHSSLTRPDFPGAFLAGEALQGVVQLVWRDRAHEVVEPACRDVGPGLVLVADVLGRRRPASRREGRTRPRSGTRTLAALLPPRSRGLLCRQSPCRGLGPPACSAGAGPASGSAARPLGPSRTARSVGGLHRGFWSGVASRLPGDAPCRAIARPRSGWAWRPTCRASHLGWAQRAASGLPAPTPRSSLGRAWPGGLPAGARVLRQLLAPHLFLIWVMRSRRRVRSASRMACFWRARGRVCGSIWADARRWLSSISISRKHSCLSSPSAGRRPAFSASTSWSSGVGEVRDRVLEVAPCFLVHLPEVDAGLEPGCSAGGRRPGPGEEGLGGQVGAHHSVVFSQVRLALGRAHAGHESREARRCPDVVEPGHAGGRLVVWVCVGCRSAVHLPPQVRVVRVPGEEAHQPRAGAGCVGWRAAVGRRVGAVVEVPEEDGFGRRALGRAQPVHDSARRLPRQVGVAGPVPVGGMYTAMMWSSLRRQRRLARMAVPPNVSMCWTCLAMCSPRMSVTPRWGLSVSGATVE